METREFLAAKPFSSLLKVKNPIFFRLREKTQTRTAPVLMISVIIPAHNEERYLPQTLESLARQNYGWFEVIVVANGCSDRTAALARGHCHRLIVLSQKSLGVARNLGARMAKGELLVFLDADTLLETDALRTMAQEFRAKDAAGTVRGVPDCVRLKYRLLYALKNLVHRSGLHHGSSGVIICWKKQFMGTGGFDEGLEVRENSHLIRRLCYQGNYRYFQDISATTSMRRYDKRGCSRMVWLWFKLWFQSLFGDLHHRPYETVR